MIWDEEWECADRSRILELQTSRLRDIVSYCYHNVPFYRNRFRENGIKPDDICGLDDLRRLPFTTKEDLRDNYPFGMLAVPVRKLVRLHASSGTTGKPTAVGYTRADLATWTDLVARIVTQAGVGEDDVAQICFGYGLFTGGFGLHYGLERAGAAVIPASSGNTEKQLMLMQDFGTTALISTPSYALYMAEVAESIGIDPRGLPLRVGLFGGEPWSESMRAEIEERWDIKATDNYGLSEVLGPGVAGECLYQDGMHVAEDHFIVEVIDPQTGEQVPDGEEGELVITTLTKEALPVLRYRTRDISRLQQETCRCGRTSARMTKVTGRTDDMLIIRGVNVFPSQVEDVLMQVRGVGPHYQIVVDKQGYMDVMEVDVELAPDFFSDDFSRLEELTRRIEDRLKSVLEVSAKVKLVEYQSLGRTTGKSQRVVDKRNKGTMLL